MADLRWVLLIAGVLLFGGIFVWTRYRDPIRALLARVQKVTAGRRAAKAVPDRDRREPLLEPEAAEGAHGSGPVDEAGSTTADGTGFHKIVTVRLLCRQRPGFPAEQLVLALREAGLRHGRYGIFHRQENDTLPPRFSVANLVEPGSFDLSRLRTDHYPGVSLFMILESPRDAVVVFDDMVATARNLARDLGGELVDEQGSTLSIQRERYLREELIALQHRQSLAG